MDVVYVCMHAGSTTVWDAYEKQCGMHGLEQGAHCAWHVVFKSNAMVCVCRLSHMAHMAMPHHSGDERLPTSNRRRMELRDAKMWRRETERQLRTGARTSRCPCRLCLFGRPLLRSTQAKHLRDYGRHPMKRLPEEVHSPLRIDFLVCDALPKHAMLCASSYEAQYRQRNHKLKTELEEGLGSLAPYKECRKRQWLSCWCILLGRHCRMHIILQISVCRAKTETVQMKNGRTHMQEWIQSPNWGGEIDGGILQDLLSSC